MKHNSKGFWEIIEVAEEKGFRVVNNGNNVQVFPRDKSLPMYTCHASERGIHPLRRYLERTERLLLTRGKVSV